MLLSAKNLRIYHLKFAVMFSFQDEPEVLFWALDYDDSFIGMPLVRVKIQNWDEL